MVQEHRIGGFANTDCEAVEITLTAGDFRSLSPANDPPLDLSAAGSELTFGFMRATTNSSASGSNTRTTGIDNWLVEVHRVQE